MESRLEKLSLIDGAKADGGSYVNMLEGILMLIVFIWLYMLQLLFGCGGWRVEK